MGGVCALPSTDSITPGRMENGEWSKRSNTLYGCPSSIFTLNAEGSKMEEGG